MMRIVQDMWRDNPIRMLVLSSICFAFGALAVLGVNIMQSAGPAIVIQHDQKNDVIVRGVEVSVLVHQVRKRSTCPGSFATRKMVRYWPDNTVRDIVFIREHDVGIGAEGTRNYTLHLHLFSPLEGDDWFYVAEINDNCSWIPDLLRRRPVSTEPAPVRMEAEDGSAPPPGLTTPKPNAKLKGILRHDFQQENSHAEIPCQGCAGSNTRPVPLMPGRHAPSAEGGTEEDGPRSIMTSKPPK